MAAFDIRVCHIKIGMYDAPFAVRRRIIPSSIQVIPVIAQFHEIPCMSHRTIGVGCRSVNVFGCNSRAGKEQLQRLRIAVADRFVIDECAIGLIYV